MKSYLDKDHLNSVNRLLNLVNTIDVLIMKEFSMMFSSCSHSCRLDGI